MWFYINKKRPHYLCGLLLGAPGMARSAVTGAVPMRVVAVG
jgi:hypothetical protein